MKDEPLSFRAGGGAKDGIVFSWQGVGGCSSAPCCCAAEPQQLVLVPARLSRNSRHTFPNLCACAAEPPQI